MACSIVSLPAELISLTLSFGQSHSALSLWKCGCKLLNQKLANGGVLAVVLKDENPKNKGRWPNVLGAFRFLNKLVLRRGSRPFDGPITLREGLQSLPSTLLHLEVHSADIPEALNRAELGLEEFADNTDSAQRISLYRAQHMSESGFWNLNETFPNLRTLIVMATASLEQDLMNEYDFALLPRSLTAFQFNFPLSLRENIFEYRFDFLPTDLLSLKWTTSQSVFMGSLCYLPRSLTEYSQTSFGFDPTTRSFFMSPIVDPETVTAALPKNLTSLTLGTFDLSPLGLPHLTHLETRTSVTLAGMKRVAHASPSQQLPPPISFFLGLSSLSIAGMWEIGGDYLQTLPHTLTRLTIRNNPILWDKIKASQMPPRLLEITLDGARVSETFFTLLPRTVTSINCGLSYSSPRIAAFPKNALPPNLCTFRWLPSSDNGAIEPLLGTVANTLPKSLRSLAIPGCASHAAEFFLKKLPPLLQDLTLLNTVIRDDHWSSESLAHLPRQLTVLTIKGAPADCAFFEFLPRTLKKLHLEVSTWGDALRNKVKLLPLGLKRLHLCGVSIWGTEFRGLPRSLRHFTSPRHLPVTVTDWLPKHFAELPPRLKCIIVRLDSRCAAGVGREVADLLPPTINPVLSSFYGDLDMTNWLYGHEDFKSDTSTSDKP